MTSDPARRVALVEDDDDLRLAMRQSLTLAGYDVIAFASGVEAVDAIPDDFAGVVVSDVRMPHMSGIDLFNRISGRDAELPFVLVTGHGDVAMAVDALKAGAWDFLTKPFDPDMLIASVARGCDKRALVLENRRLRAMMETPASSPLIGHSPAINRLRATIETLAGADIDVLIEGETGTGKELIARLIHQRSRRAKGRFITIACAALPDILIDTTLDGEMLAGRSPVEGRVAQADRGTLFLDDIDQASPALQARIIQLLEERLVRPAGAREPRAVDMRVIGCASEGADQAGRIQPALFYRLAAVRMRVPPLRERLDDVVPLFAHLLDAAAGRFRRSPPALSTGVLRRLADHDWPGNVHELARFADRLMLGLEDPGLADPGHQDDASDDGPPAPLTDRVDAFERDAIIDAVRLAGGDIGKTIDLLGLPRKTFYYKVHRHGLDLRALRERSRRQEDPTGRSNMPA